MERKLSADDFRSLFGDLAEELARRGVRGEVHLAGGAVMSVEYNSELISGDADAQFAPDGPMHEAIAAVADKRGVSRSWLNNQASVYFSTLVEQGKTIFEHPNLVVMVTPPEQAPGGDEDPGCPSHPGPRRPTSPGRLPRLDKEI